MLSFLAAIAQWLAGLVLAALTWLAAWLSARATWNQAFTLLIIAVAVALAAGGLARLALFRVREDPQAPPAGDPEAIAEGPEHEHLDLPPWPKPE